MFLWISQIAQILMLVLRAEAHLVKIEDVLAHLTDAVTAEEARDKANAEAFAAQVAALSQKIMELQALLGGDLPAEVVAAFDAVNVRIGALDPTPVA